MKFQTDALTASTPTHPAFHILSSARATPRTNPLLRVILGLALRRHPEMTAQVCSLSLPRERERAVGRVAHPSISERRAGWGVRENFLRLSFRKYAPTLASLRFGLPSYCSLTLAGEGLDERRFLIIR